MKKGKLTELVMTALLVGSTAFFTPNAEAAVQVNPIQGMRADFIKGADVSMLPELEMLGGKFYEDGVQKDCIEILKDHGVNWVRVRIWNNPQNVGGGNTDEARAIQIVTRAHALGMKALIDFHYSDWWVDPGKQNPPAAWQHDNAQQLARDVYDYTNKVLKDFKAQGQTPDMVQVGNEINNGMLWPEGKLTSPQSYKNVASFLAAGLKAVHDNDPEHQIKTMIHLANGGDNGLYRNFFDQLITDNRVNDFDIIGLSFYPFWHGTMEQLSYNLNDISERYKKNVIVVETAFGYTNENFDSQKNCYGPNEERLGGYKSTPQGQATGLHDIMQQVVSVPNQRGMGMFYWEPDWIAVPGAGWKTNEGNEWDNLTLFDDGGNALDSMDVFKLVSDPNGVMVSPVISSVTPVAIEGGLNQAVELPRTVDVVYSNDSIKAMPVVWESANPSYAEPGSYTVSGTVQGTDEHAVAAIKIIQKTNLVKNGGFESGSLSGWTISGISAAVNTVSTAGDVCGKAAMHYWLDKAFDFQAAQSFTGLKDGKYTLSCWTQGSGGEASYQLMVKDYGGSTLTADIKDIGWNQWHQTVIRDVEVKGGKATIAIDMKANAGNWGSIDDVEFFLQEE